MQDQHLRPVPPIGPDAETNGDEDVGNSTSSGASGPGGGRPTSARPRPKKELPTDRMKLEVQKKALSVIAMLSDGEKGVGSADMAPRLGVASTTAGLNNSFFADCGLIESAPGKSRYKSTEAANDFARKYSFDPDRAGHALRDPLSKSWFAGVVSTHIEHMGPTSKDQLIELLAYEAGTTSDHRVRLGSLLSWLEYAGLIELVDGSYKLSGTSPETPKSSDDQSAREPETPKPDPTPEGATKAGESGGGLDQPAETILGFSFDFALTGDQLAQLSPEQITALFNAVGEVMAIQAAAK